MKMSRVFRSVACLLALALLLPCYAAAPVSAADAEAEVLYEFVPYDRETDMAAIKTNLFTKKEASSIRYTEKVTKYTPDGPVIVPTAGFYNNVEAGGNYGLPYEQINSNFRRFLENLKLEFVQMPTIPTRGKEVINVQLEFIHVPGLNTMSMVFDNSMRVFVSVDGENYLEDSVGMRCATFTAGGLDTSGRSMMFYDVQSENLLDIKGLKATDRIRKIMIMPDGQFKHVFGKIVIGGMKVNGYASKAAFETRYPHPETVTLDPELLRQIVLEESERVGNTAWTTDSTIYTVCPIGLSTIATEAVYQDYMPGYTYYGPVYERNSNCTRERYQAYIVNGKHTAGYGNDNAMGMDCGTYAYNSISRVSRNFAYMTANSMSTTGVRLIDGLKSHPRPVLTGLDVVNYNTEQEMYQAYAKARGGDIAIQYSAGGAVHSRVVRGTDVVYRADGSIDPDKSIMHFCEQSSRLHYEIRLADGSHDEIVVETPEELEQYLADHAGSKVEGGHSTLLDSQYSFANLRQTQYVPLTLDVYDDGKVEKENVGIFIDGRESGDFVTGGLAISISSNYRIISDRVVLEDLSQGRTLFDQLTYADQPRVIVKRWLSNDLDAILAGLTNGTYRLTVEVASGPLTALGQSQVPVTTKSVDFTVTNKAPKAAVTLSSPASAGKGAQVTVSVQTNAAYDAADVEIKFDTDALDYQSGAVTPDCPVKGIVRDQGVLRISCVDAAASAGTLAQLTFTATEDLARLSDVITVKSAFLTTANDAGTQDAVKAVDGVAADPSVRFADVSANAWYHGAVSFVVKNGVMSGYSASTFGPNNVLSRAMVVQVLYNKENKPASTAPNPFKDIAGDQWYFNAVRWGADKNVVAGYGGGVFKPDDNVTIEQVAVILHNYSGKPASAGDASVLGAHSDWAEPALIWATEKGILRDLPYDAVTAPATRAQTAQMLMNYLQNA